MSSIHFCASSYRFRDITNLNLLSSKSRSRSPFDGKCQNLKLLLSIFFALAFTVCQKLIFKLLTLQIQFKVTEAKNGTCAVRSEMFQCVLLNFLVILASGNIRKRTNFTNFKHLKSKRQVKATEYNFRNDTIRWQISKSTKDIF